ncbi:MAG: tetratricopeptide repeat protein [Bacteroidales bacterium]|nr:tetratricopeptide repeat protein [Bacteroidales bacterium]
MKIKFFIFSFVFLLFTGYFNIIFAQQSGINEYQDDEYKLGLELFSKQKYGAAQNAFLHVVNNLENDDISEIKATSEYYIAICALELRHEDALQQLNRFITDYPANAKIPRAYFQLGKLQFRERNYRDALRSLKKTNVRELSRAERTEYYFETGYCYLNNKDIPNAKSAFASIKDNKSEYQTQANYYYSHIAYLQGDYDIALEGFKNLENNRMYNKIIPFYIIHIHHHNGDFEKITQDGPALFKKAQRKNKADLAKIIGNAFFQHNDFVSSMEYYEFFENRAKNLLKREDNYQIGFTYFRNGYFNNAIKYFQKVISKDDELTQNAYYHLADCYIKIDQKKFASSAFLSAYKLDFDKNIQEDALFNYAKLSTEVSNDPYNEAIRLLEEYIKKYPDSERVPEAYTYLVQLFLSTSNYKEALVSIEKIKNKNNNLKSAYQKITFYRGVELFNNNKFEEAIELFKKAGSYNYSKSIKAKANFWMGDAFYRLSNYWGAIKYFKAFLNMTGASQLQIYNSAYYNLAYTYFKKEDYGNAIFYFKKFIAKRKNENVKLVNDAYLRMGDCYFVNSDFDNAVSNFNKALRLNQADVDYALYQKALAQGALALFNDKIKTLDHLVKYYPKSRWIDDAYYEMATSSMLQNDNRSALVYFDKLIKTHPKSNYVKNSLLKTGLIYYNNDQSLKAIKALKKVIDNYPGTPESKNALASLQNVYIDLGNVNEYFKYSENLSFANVSSSEQDSITYVAAENQYMSNKCENAISSFSAYIEKFQFGVFLVNAHYYKAQCEYKRDSLIKALHDYEFVINEPKTHFTEKSLLQASIINFKYKMYDAALHNYIQLEENAENNTNINIALDGQMKCNYLINNFKESIVAANKLLKNEKVTQNQMREAHYFLGKSYFEIDDMYNAKREFEICSKLTKNKMSAEAKYYIAFIDYEKNNFKDAEKLIFELAEQFSSYDYWVAKSFILLSDVYIGLDNIFQAKQTLNSIIENYEGQNLRKIAQEKLDAILEMEKAEEIDNASKY